MDDGKSSTDKLQKDMRKLVPITILLLLPAYLWCGSTGQSYDTLTIMTYNVEWFSNTSNDYERLKYFRRIIGNLKPDLICVQEISDQTGARLFYDNVMCPIDDDYEVSSFSEIQKYENDNLLFYNSEKVTHIHTHRIKTDLRDIAAYYLQLNKSTNRTRLILFSTHLKASSDEETRRWKEVKEFQKYIDTLSVDYPLIFVGDLNLYTAEEPAYKLLLDSMRIKLYDPLNSPENWHENSSFAWLHTQATRTYYNGRSYGGLDDRFDFILMSYHFFNSENIRYVDGSYTAFGNDGFHFNKPINVEPFSGPGRDRLTADALFYASDHLPVTAKFYYPAETSIDEKDEPIPDKISLVAYPNPFNSAIRIRTTLPHPGKYRLSVFNLYGEEIISSVLSSHSKNEEKEIIWETNSSRGKNIPAGIYFVKISSGEGLSQIRKIICLK